MPTSLILTSFCFERFKLVSPPPSPKRKKTMLKSYIVILYYCVIQLCQLKNYLVVGKRGFRQRLKPEDDVDPLIPLFPHEWPPEEIKRNLKASDVIPDVIPCSPKYVINVSQ